MSTEAGQAKLVFPVCPQQWAFGIMIYRRIQGLVGWKIREHGRLCPHWHLEDVQGIGGGHIPSEFRIQAFHFFKGNPGGFGRSLQMDWTRDRHLLVLDWRLRKNIESE